MANSKTKTAQKSTRRCASKTCKDCRVCGDWRDCGDCGNCGECTDCSDYADRFDCTDCTDCTDYNYWIYWRSEKVLVTDNLKARDASASKNEYLLSLWALHSHSFRWWMANLQFYECFYIRNPHEILIFVTTYCKFES